MAKSQNISIVLTAIFLSLLFVLPVAGQEEGTGDDPSQFPLAIAPSFYDFGAVQVGQTKQATFWVDHKSGSNRGPLLGSLSVSSPFHCIDCSFSDLSSTGSSQQVTVEFRPSSQGSFSAVLSGPAEFGGAAALRGQGTTGQGASSGKSQPKSCGQTCPPGAVCIENPLNACSFAELIDNIIKFIFTIAIAITPIMVIIGGFMFVTGGGDPAKITRAKQLLLWTVIGLTVILLARSLVAVLRSVLGI